MDKHGQIDMLHGPIWNKLPRFALPIAATAILEQLFNASDVAVVGNFTGGFKTIAVAAVGANSPVIGLVLNLFIGIALGVNVVIATASGRGDAEAVRRTVYTAVTMSVVCGALIAAAGELAAPALLGMMNVPGEVLPHALTYLRIYLLGMPVILLYNFESAIFRSVGETAVPLRALFMSGILNVLLNLLFVIAFKMTVDGVAIATVIANAVSAAVLLRRLVRTDEVIALELKSLRIDRDSLVRIVRIGLPAGVQSAVFAVSNIVVQSAINGLGTVAMAASSAALNIEMLVYYVLNAFAQACTTFVGQNYGARQTARCKRTLFLSLAEDLLTSAAVAAALLLAGERLMAVFNSEPEVIAVGCMRLRIVFAAYAFTVLYEVMSGYLRGFGISLVPAVLTTLGVCGVRILWVAAVFPLDRTFKTVVLAYPASLAATALLMLAALLYYRPSRRFADREHN